MECILRAQDTDWKRVQARAFTQTGYTLMSSQKVIFHLEAFVAKFMRLYEG